jgi:hypothetical protein
MFVHQNKDTHVPSLPDTGRSFLCYVDGFRISREAQVWACKAFYGDSFILLYVDDIRSPREAHVWASTACYGSLFTFLCVDDAHTSQETHL